MTKGLQSKLAMIEGRKQRENVKVWADLQKLIRRQIRACGRQDSDQHQQPSPSCSFRAGTHSTAARGTCGDGSVCSLPSDDLPGAAAHS